MPVDEILERFPQGAAASPVEPDRLRRLDDLIGFPAALLRKMK